MTPPTIAFPALQISPRDSFAVVPAIPVEATALALSSGYFAGLYLVDSTGTLFPVVSAMTTRPLSWLDRLMNRRVSVTLVFDEPRPAELQQIASDLCRLIEHDPDDLYDDHESLKERISSAQSPAALVAALSNGAA